MTPAIQLLKKYNIPYKLREYQHETDAVSYGLEAAQKLRLPEQQVFKTLVVELDAKELVVTVIPVTHQLNLKLTAKAFSAKKAVMANKDKVARSTGYIMGGVSPLGQKKLLRTNIDSRAQNYSSIFVSAGRRGLNLELSPEDLKALSNASFNDLVQDST
jgi:Cys-tRNA(Pro)/Cys-tRNA(Cys) deacylase